MILDTNALSAWLDGDPALRQLLETARSIYLNPISLGEYRFGILDSRHRSAYAKQLALIETEIPTLAVTALTSGHYAEIRRDLKRRGRPIPANDLWIAAIGRENALPIVTNDAHFDEVIGLQRIGWPSF